ncbi:probable polygalacturonase At3g15720 [Papaver somniferum]|uniref:probable polygalacturonase At3g15720 n=1 Tax=Papaver somniferum TaxID=3469 RepID=UPI000E6FD155|nr:probable polygalacturonase At3g15720 [Papaver somniferum]
MEFFRIIWVIYCSLSIIQGKAIGASRYGNDENPVFNVMDHSAIGDGIADDYQAFLDAWTTMCNTAATNAILVVPKGKTFVVSRISFNGTCTVQKPFIQVDGDIVAPTREGWSGGKSRPTDTWITFNNVNGLTINGSGRIDGRGSYWWDLHDKNRPSALRLENCNDCQLSWLTHVNSQRNHISISDCNNVVISHVNIIAPEDSPNTDGIDISLSQNIRIEHSSIGTGDDCVAINGGCKFINITDVNCGPGHGISIGSLGKNGKEETVEEVHVHSVIFSGTMNGARIKTWEGGRGFARKISFDQIIVSEVYNPIVIDQHYFSDQSSVEASAVAISDVTFNGISGTSTNDIVINLNCSAVIPCTSISMSNINIQSTNSVASSNCENARGTVIETSPDVPCLT